MLEEQEWEQLRTSHSHKRDTKWSLLILNLRGYFNSETNFHRKKNTIITSVFLAVLMKAILIAMLFWSLIGLNIIINHVSIIKLLSHKHQMIFFPVKTLFLYHFFLFVIFLPWKMLFFRMNPAAGVKILLYSVCLGFQKLKQTATNTAQWIFNMIKGSIITITTSHKKSRLPKKIRSSSTC